MSFSLFKYFVDKSGFIVPFQPRAFQDYKLWVFDFIVSLSNFNIHDTVAPPPVRMINFGVCTMKSYFDIIA